jgi:uncharacterized membrane protein YccF (DUF307 family)
MPEVINVALGLLLLAILAYIVLIGIPEWENCYDWHDYLKEYAL